MDKHPSPEKIELFLKDELTADESLEILLHLESCQKCQISMPEQNSEEVLKIFFHEDSDDQIVASEKVVEPQKD